MNKRILILGIGPSQVDLIELCKEKNMEVFACAYESTGPGKDLVDEFRVIDIKDIDGVEAYAREKKVDMIFTMASEVGVKTMAIVSEKLNLPHFISSEAAEILTSKAKWRKRLNDLEGNLRFMTGKRKEDFINWKHYPSFLKPVDGSGQRGVYQLESYDDLLNFFDESIKFSRSKVLILEEMANGPEISVNAFMQGGKLAFAAISDRISYSEYPGGIIKEHHLPTKVLSEEGQERVYVLVEEVCKKTGFNDGPVYFQLKVVQDYPKLIEYTPRFDGCHMWRLIKEAFDLDLREVALEWLANGHSELLSQFESRSLDGKYKLVFLSDKPGTIVLKENYDIPDEKNYLQWYYEEGEEVRSVTGYFEKMGYYTIKEKQ